MGQTVKLRRSAVPGKVPINSQLQLGELSVNTADGKLFFAKSGSLGPSIEEIITTNTQNTGSIDLVGALTASVVSSSFIGDGSELYNIPASGVVGLSLDQISSDGAVAAITAEQLDINVNTVIDGSLTATEITGSGLGLTNVPVNISGSSHTLTNYDGLFTKIYFDESTGIKVEGDTSTGIAKIYLDGVASDGGVGSTKFIEVTTPSSTWTFNHGLGEKYPSIMVFDSNDNVIIPQNIEVVSTTQLVVSFASPQIGYATATVGGGLPSTELTDNKTLVTVSGVPTWKDGILSGSVSFNSFSSSIDTIIGSLETESSSIRGDFNSHTLSLNTYTSSNNSIVVDLVSETGSYQLKSNFNSYTSSISAINTTQNARIGSLEGFTASIDDTYATDSDLNAYTSSNNIRVDSIESKTGSFLIDSDLSTLEGQVSSLETTSGSHDGRLDSIESKTGSFLVNSDLSTLEGQVGSLEIESGSVRSTLNTYTSSNDGRVDSIESQTGSYLIDSDLSTLEGQVGSLETESGSVRSALNTYTSSNDSRVVDLVGFKDDTETAIELTGSNVTIKGNLLVKGTETRVNSTTVEVSDNVISLNGSGAANGGIEVRDVTSPGILSGSLIWDGTENKWKGGIKGSEDSFVLEGDLNTFTSSNDGRLDSLETSTASLNSFTSSINTTIRTKLDAEGVISGSIQIDHDSTTNFVANEHIDHSTITIGSGKGLTGGGTIETSRSLTLDTGSAHFLSGVKSKLNTETVVSGSVQIDITGTTNYNLVDGRLDSLESNSGSYLTSYTETDTLSDVVSRGSTTNNNVTFNGVGDSVLIGDTLRIDENGSGLRMTNVGAFDNSSGNFRIFSTNDLILSTNGDTGTAVTIDATTKDANFVGDVTATNLNISNWDTAYGWGNHASVGYITGFTNTNEFVTGATFNNGDGVVTFTRNNGGDTFTVDLDGRYLTSFTETDPIFTASPSAGITDINITNWDTAYGWGDHASVGYITGFTNTNEFTTGATFNSGNGIVTFTRNNGGDTFTVDLDGRYLTSFTETDPIFTASPSAGITDINITNWDTAYGWGDHASVGYITGFTNTNEFTTGATFNSGNGIVTFTRNNGGDTFTVDLDGRYLTSFTETDPIFTASPSAGITNQLITNWDTAYGWGDHSTEGYLTTYNDEYTTGATFNTGNGVITFTRNDGDTFTVDIDNRYLTSYNDEYTTGVTWTAGTATLTFTRNDGDTYDVQMLETLTDVTVTGGTYASGTQILTLTKSDGSTVDVSGFAIDTDVNWYTTGATFNTGNGIITGTNNNGGTWTVDIDNRYLQLGGGTLTGNLTLNSANPEILFNGTSDAGVDMAIKATPEGLDFYEPEDSNKIHFQILDDTGVNAAFGLQIGGTQVLSSGRVLSNVTGNISMFTNDSNYLTSFTETDPIFTASPSAGITNQLITNWDTAYGWGNHASAGYITGYSEVDTLDSVTDRGATTSNDITVGKLTTTWGEFTTTNNTNPGVDDLNVSGFGALGNRNTNPIYLHNFGDGGVRIGVNTTLGNGANGVFINDTTSTFYTDVTVTGTLSASGYNDSNWNTAYGWGDHSTEGYITGFTDTNEFVTGATFNSGNGVITFTRNNGGDTFTVDLDGRYLTSVTNISGYSGTLLAQDNRTISPSELSANLMKFGFTSWDNNNSGPYADFLHLRSYGDTSGGADNLVMFKKSGIGMRIWQQTYGSATAYSSYEDVWTTGGITTTQVSNWDTAYGWGDHSQAGYTGDQDLSGYLLNTTDTFSGNLTFNGGNNNSKESFLNVKRGSGAGLWLKFQTDSTSTNDVSQFVIRRSTDNVDILSISAGSGNLTVPGTLSASGYNKTNWDTAYGWGDHSGVYLPIGGGTLTGDLTVGSTSRTSNTVIRALSGDSNISGFEAYGSSQGNGYLYVGQSTTHGGGISYNGDNSPAFVNSETADRITFYRRTAGVNSEVFSYNHNSDSVYFNGEILPSTINTGQGSTEVHLMNQNIRTTDDVQFGKGKFSEQVSVNNRTAISVAHWGASSNTTGAIKIKVPGTHTSNWSMFVLRITTYEYNSNAHAIYYVSGHDWTSGWYQNGVTVQGSGKALSLGFSTGANEDYIILGDVGSTWQYGHVTVDVVVHPEFYSSSMDITEGWSITQETDLDGITINSVTNKQLLDTSNYGTNISNWNTAFGWGDHSTEGYATQTYVGDQIDLLVDTAPGTLDTLNELAAALGDDPNFATTITTSIGNKLPLSGGSLSGDLTIGKSDPTLTFLDTAGSNTNPNGQIKFSELNGTTNFELNYNGASDRFEFRGLEGGVDSLLGYFTRSTTNTFYVTGKITSSGGNSDQWNTAYGWGDHSLAGYTGDQDLTGYATETYVGDQIDLLVDTAPGTLDTLNELAAALGDDPNFATTITTSIATKLPLSGGVMSGNIGRSAHNEGYLVGGYNNIGASATATNPIFTIGTSYLPAVTTLGNMYGIGYTRGDASFMGIASGSGWGMYVAADGDARIWLDGSTGDIVASGTLSASGYNDSNWNTAYGWGDHSTVGYITGYSEVDTLASVTSRGSSTTTALQINSNDFTEFRSAVDNSDAGIRFSSMTAGTQFGDFTFNHVNTASYGSLASFKITSSESSLTILADGKLMFKEGIYSKPATGTGAGTRKDSNWDTAYGWGNHAGRYMTEGLTLTGINTIINGGNRYDPSTDNPTNEHYAVLTYGNRGNVTGQLATHYVTGNLYSRGYNSNWSTWRRYWNDTDFTSTNVSNWNTAYGWGDHSGVYLPIGGKAADSNLLDGYDQTDFIRIAANSNSPTNALFAIGSDGGKNFIQSHSGQVLDINPLGNAVTVGSSLTVSGTIAATGGDSDQWNTAYGWGDHSGVYLPIGGKAADSELLDGLDSTSFLRSNAADTFTGTITMGTQKALVANNYGRGVYGLYSATRYQHVWSMGTAYNLSDDGTSNGNLYGLAFTHTNIGGQSKSGLSHQMLLMENGITKTAIGTGIWTAGVITASGGNSTQWNSAYTYSTVGHLTSSSTLNASNMTTGTLPDVFSPSTRYNIGLIDGNSSQTRDKLRVWTDSNYVIGMKSGYGFGHLGNSEGTNTEYAMSFQMNNQEGRGFWWGGSSDNDNQGAMGLTHDGKANIKTSLSIGEGNTISPSTTPLYVEGSTAGETVFEVQGTSGQLFSITDSLIGDIFEVSDISGVPIFTVNSSGIVTVDDTLHVKGDVIAYYASDRRLKDNIKPIENSIDKIKMIGGYEFDWNSKSKNNHGHDVGVIAQEIEEVLPELVGTRSDGFKGVKYEKLTALLIQANKELIERVEELESKLKK